MSSIVKRLSLLSVIIAQVIWLAPAGAVTATCNHIYTVPDTGTAARAGAVRVGLWGDSITDGYKVPGGYRNNLVPTVETAQNVDFVGSQHTGPTTLADQDNEGHIGWCIEQLTAQAPTWLSKHQPQAIYLMIGTNDVIQNHDLANAPGRLLTLINTICVKDPGVRLTVSSIVPRPGLDAQVNAYNKAVPGVVSQAAATGCLVSFYDLNAHMVAGDISSDATHPTAAGYDKMAGLLTPVVENMVAQINGTTPPTPPVTPPTPPVTPKAVHGLTGQYFKNTTLTGTPDLTRVDTTLNNPVSPFGTVYSAKWTGKIVLPVGGNWRFGAHNDGGVRIYVNGILVVQDWNDRGLVFTSGYTTLAAGTYSIEVDYFNTTGSSQIGLRWENDPTVAWNVPPSSALWSL